MTACEHKDGTQWPGRPLSGPFLKIILKKTPTILSDSSEKEKQKETPPKLQQNLVYLQRKEHIPTPHSICKYLQHTEE